MSDSTTAVLEMHDWTGADLTVVEISQNRLRDRALGIHEALHEIRQSLGALRSSGEVEI